jgi:hypothetical protein
MMKKALILFITGLFCVVHIAFGVCADCPENTVSGPTMVLEYQDGGRGNPVDTFMYFLPLVAPTTIDV